MDIIILSLATFIGIYMAANIGANDLANAMGTSVGSRAITLKQAILISIIANALGATLAGGYVTNTISKGIIDPTLLVGEPEKFMMGMFAALISAGICVNLATFFGLPVSTTHAIVGGVVGFGLLSVGASAVSWGKIVSIVLSWVVSPLMGGLIGGGMYFFAEKKILSTKDPYASAEHYAPFLIFLVVLVLILSFIFKGLKNLHLEIAFFNTVLMTIPVAIIAAFLGRRWVQWQMRRAKIRSTERQSSPVESLFAKLQILTACYVAFAHGANDVANAVGPLAAIFSVIKTGAVALRVEVPFWMLLVGGMAVGGGLMAFGTRVIRTIGENITEITPVRGFSAQFGAATTILVCSRLGFPISTTHVLVGSVVGVGIMRGMGTIDLRVLKNIGLSWIVTLPFTILLSMLLYKLLMFIMI